MKSVSGNNASHQVPLTAHVLIAMEETSGVLQGKSKQFVSSGRSRAISYLERNLPTLTDAYELAITTYALALAKSPMSDIAYGMMKAAASVSGGGMNYWGRTEIKTNRYSKQECLILFLILIMHMDSICSPSKGSL